MNRLLLNRECGAQGVVKTCFPWWPSGFQRTEDKYLCWLKHRDNWNSGTNGINGGIRELGTNIKEHWVWAELNWVLTEIGKPDISVPIRMEEISEIGKPNMRMEEISASGQIFRISGRLAWPSCCASHWPSSGHRDNSVIERPRCLDADASTHQPTNTYCTSCSCHNTSTLYPGFLSLVCCKFHNAESTIHKHALHNY